MPVGPDRYAAELPRRRDLSCATGGHAAELPSVGTEADLGLPARSNRYAAELRDTDTGGDDMSGGSDRYAAELPADCHELPGGYDGDTAELRADQRAGLSDGSNRYAAELRAGRDDLPDGSDRYTAELQAGHGGLPSGYNGHASELHACGCGMPPQLHRQAAKLRMQYGLFRPDLCA